jgi:hypothetical protein
MFILVHKYSMYGGNQPQKPFKGIHLCSFAEQRPEEIIENWGNCRQLPSVVFNRHRWPSVKEDPRVKKEEQHANGSRPFKDIRY